MRRRCEPRHAKFQDWGARGIKVCARWQKFRNFLADMGEKPEGLTLERRDNNGDYKPSNCYWATVKEQARNRRTTKLTDDQVAQLRAAPAMVGVRNRKSVVRELAEEFGISVSYAWHVRSDRWT